MDCSSAVECNETSPGLVEVNQALESSLSEVPDVHEDKDLLQLKDTLNQCFCALDDASAELFNVEFRLNMFWGKLLNYSPSNEDKERFFKLVHGLLDKNLEYSPDFENACDKLFEDSKAYDRFMGFVEGILKESSLNLDITANGNAEMAPKPMIDSVTENNEAARTIDTERSTALIDLDEGNQQKDVGKKLAITGKMIEETEEEADRKTGSQAIESYVQQILVDPEETSEMEFRTTLESFLLKEMELNKLLETTRDIEAIAPKPAVANLTMENSNESAIEVDLDSGLSNILDPKPADNHENKNIEEVLWPSTGIPNFSK